MLVAPTLEIQEIRGLREHLHQQTIVAERERERFAAAFTDARSREEQLWIDCELAQSQLQLLTQADLKGLESTAFEIEKLRQQVSTTSEACHIMQDELMETRSRELRLQDSFQKAQQSTAMLAKDNHRLQTGYNEIYKAAEREMVQTKQQHEQNLAALGDALQLTKAEHQQQVTCMEDGHETYKNLTKSAIRGANQLRREKDEKLAGMEAALVEKADMLRRREGILKCQLEVSHENTDRVLSENDELQTVVDRLTREKRALQRDLEDSNSAFERSQQLCRDLEDSLEEAKRLVDDNDKEGKEMLKMAQSEAENKLVAQTSLASDELSGERDLYLQEVAQVRRELEAQQKIEADGYVTKIEDAEERYRAAQDQVTKLQGLLVEAQERHEVQQHITGKKIAELQGLLDTSNLHVARVDAEKLALEQMLSTTREEAHKVQQSLQADLQNAESLLQMYTNEIELHKRTKKEQYDQFKEEKTLLNEALANEKRISADANYNLEATAKRLGDAVNAERTAHTRTKNEADQVQLRLRRDLQAAREAAEKYHNDKVLETMALKLEKQRASVVRQEMHGALQAVDIMRQERDLAELRCEEVEWSSEMRCNRLVTDKLTSSTKSKEEIAKHSVARKFAEDQAQLAAARARSSEDELVDLQATLKNALSATQNLEKEKKGALMMLSAAQERTEKMEEDQQMLLGYADAVASQLEISPPSPLRKSMLT